MEETMLEKLPSTITFQVFKIEKRWVFLSEPIVLNLICEDFYDPLDGVDRRVYKKITLKNDEFGLSGFFVEHVANICNGKFWEQVQVVIEDIQEQLVHRYTALLEIDERLLSEEGKELLNVFNRLFLAGVPRVYKQVVDLENSHGCYTL